MELYKKAIELWQKKNITTDAELAEALNSHSIAFAYNSGKIENENITYHDTREIFEHDGVTAYTGDLRTLFEIRNAKNANELFLTAFNEKRPLDETFLLELQKCLTENTYDTRRWRLGERPEDARDEVLELLEELKDIKDKDALTAAAYFHAKLENIHPFADGNGRTGRLIMNYFLVIHNHPPIVIYAEDRKDYYDALESWDSQQKLDLLCDFLKHQTEKTWEKQILRSESKT